MYTDENHNTSLDLRVVLMLRFSLNSQMLKSSVTMEGTPSGIWSSGISRSDINFGIDIFGEGHRDLKVWRAQALR